MRPKPDVLERYIVALAKGLLVLGGLLLIFVFSTLFSSHIDALPEPLQKVYFALYVFAGFISVLFAIILYPIAFFIPALVYLLRHFKERAGNRKRLGFVLFVLLFSAVVIFVISITPYHVV